MLVGIQTLCVVNDKHRTATVRVVPSQIGNQDLDRPNMSWRTINHTVRFAERIHQRGYLIRVDQIERLF